jgi:hypothetical protein
MTTVSSNMATDLNYQENLTNRIITLLNNVALDFNSILEQCEGAYPTSVKLTLDQLVAIKKISKDEGIYFTDNSHVGHLKELKKKYSLRAANSIPHPADYDWRFTPDTVNSSIEHIKNQYQTNIKIGLFGVTSLFKGLVDAGYETLLFNKSEYLISELQSQGYNKGLIKHDLFFPVENFSQYFELIIADPPWYLDFYSAFLGRASELIKNGGVLFLSVFPSLTRPEAIQERKAIMELAGDLGFELTSITERYFNYSTPRFEILALKTEGITLNTDWRTGDLLIFRKIRKSKKLDFQIIDSPSELWDEFVWRGKRLKLRLRPEPDLTEFGFDLVGDTSILKTVSRRYINRDKIDLWTSDNEAYRVNGLFLLKDALSLVTKNLTVDETIETLQRQYPSVTGFVHLKKLLNQL